MCATRNAPVFALAHIRRAFLQDLTAQWLREHAGNKQKTAERAAKAGTLALQGSKQLGSVMPGDDVDLVLVAARHVSRADFFRGFPRVLRAHPDVTELRAFPEAGVPLVQFALAGVSFDLKFCGIDKSEIDPAKFDPTKSSHLRVCPAV